MDMLPPILSRVDIEDHAAGRKTSSPPSIRAMKNICSDFSVSALVFGDDDDDD